MLLHIEGYVYGQNACVQDVTYLIYIVGMYGWTTAFEQMLGAPRRAHEDQRAG